MGYQAARLFFQRADSPALLAVMYSKLPDQAFCRDIQARDHA